MYLVPLVCLMRNEGLLFGILVDPPGFQTKSICQVIFIGGLDGDILAAGCLELELLELLGCLELELELLEELGRLM